MKHIKYKDQFILDEGISWEALRSTYRRARGIASKVINALLIGSVINCKHDESF